MQPEVPPNTSMKGESDSPSEQNVTQVPEVCKVTWMADDQAAELTCILKGVSVDDVERSLMQYVETNIEPAGWRAVWRASSFSSNTLLSLIHPMDFYVDVVHVSREKLQADVEMLGPVEDNLLEDVITDKIKNKEVTVPLLELYPLADQENEMLNMITTAEVVEQIRFFYVHIWQAWDMEEEQCYYDHHLIKTRLKLYHDIEDGHIPAAIGSELRDLTRKAKNVYRDIKKIESDDEERTEPEISQSDMACLIQLHKQMEQLKARFEMLQNPVLRELSTHQVPVEEYEVMSLGSSTTSVKVVVSSLSVAQLAQHMAMLPDIIKTLPQVPEDAACQTFPSLQMALNMARKGDMVMVLPGHHSLLHLGCISEGGAIIGVGDEVVVAGSNDTGDVMLDTSGHFILQNITMRPSCGQIGIVHHHGNLTLQMVTILDGRGGFVGLGDTNSQVEDVIVRGCSSVGMDFRECAKAVISRSTVEECNVGIQLEEGAKVSLVSSKVERNLKYGVLVCGHKGATSPTALFPSLTVDMAAEGNSIIGNHEEDIRVAEAWSPPRRSPSPGSPSSAASLDSGFELIENISS